MKLYTMIMFTAFTFSFIEGVQFREFNEVDFENEAVELLSKEKMRFCYISFVRIKGRKYLIKQKHVQRKILSCVRDALTAHIAEDFGIAHRVAIIRAGKDFPGKEYKEWPATIHTIAPGKMIKAQNSEYVRMDIKQADVGFRREMLHWMMKHPVLNKVVALDTFLCNHDRHRGNLFYDPSKDSFCAIDMDSVFKYNLCALACKFFYSMIHRGSTRLLHKEIKALQIYKEHLEYLIAHHKPEDTIALYDYFLEKAGFVSDSPLYTQKMQLEIDRNRRMIKESYKDAQRLVDILEEIIKKAKRDIKRMR